MDEAAIRLAARRVAAGLKRRADQGEKDLSWFDTEPGMELEESWARVQEADKGDDPVAMMTRLQILVNKTNALKEEVRESKEMRGESSLKRREVHHDKRETGPIRTRDKDRAIDNFRETQRSPWHEHAPKTGPKTKVPPTKNMPRHDTIPSA